MLHRLLNVGINRHLLLPSLKEDQVEQINYGSAEIGEDEFLLELAILDQIQVDEVVHKDEHLLGRDQINLEQSSLLPTHESVAKLLGRENDGI